MRHWWGDTGLSMHCVIIIRMKELQLSGNLQHLGHPWEKRMRQAWISVLSSLVTLWYKARHSREEQQREPYRRYWVSQLRLGVTSAGRKIHLYNKGQDPYIHKTEKEKHLLRLKMRIFLSHLHLFGLDLTWALGCKEAADTNTETLGSAPLSDRESWAAWKLSAFTACRWMVTGSR